MCNPFNYAGRLIHIALTCHVCEWATDPTCTWKRWGGVFSLSLFLSLPFSQGSRLLSSALFWTE